MSFPENNYPVEHAFINYSKQHRGSLLEMFLIFSKTDRVHVYRETLMYGVPWGGDSYQNTAVKLAGFYHLHNTGGKKYQCEFYQNKKVCEVCSEIQGIKFKYCYLPQ